MAPTRGEVPLGLRTAGLKAKRLPFVASTHKRVAKSKTGPVAGRGRGATQMEAGHAGDMCDGSGTECIAVL